MGRERSQPGDYPVLRLRTTVSLASDPITQLAIAGSGAWLVAASRESGMTLCDLASADHLMLTESSVNRLAISFDDRWLCAVSADGQDAWVWSLHERAGRDRQPQASQFHLPTRRAWSTDDAITAAAWSYDSASLYLGSASGMVWQWTFAQPDQLEQLPLNLLISPGIAVTALATSPQDNWLAVGRAHGGLGILTFGERQRERVFLGRHPHGVGALHVAVGWYLLSQSAQGPVCRLWEPMSISPWVREWRLEEPEVKPATALYPLAVDALERWAFSGRRLSELGVWRYWRWPPEDCLAPLALPGPEPYERDTRITVLATGGRGRVLAAGDAAGRVWVWDVVIQEAATSG